LNDAWSYLPGEEASSSTWPATSSAELAEGASTADGGPALISSFPPPKGENALDEGQRRSRRRTPRRFERRPETPPRRAELLGSRSPSALQSSSASSSARSPRPRAARGCGTAAILLGVLGSGSSRRACLTKEATVGECSHEKHDEGHGRLRQVSECVAARLLSCGPRPPCRFCRGRGRHGTSRRAEARV